MKNLPEELIGEIMEYVPLRNLPKLMAANKRIGAIAKKQAYKKVVFTSLSQRTQFFEILSKLIVEVPGIRLLPLDINFLSVSLLYVVSP